MHCDKRQIEYYHKSSTERKYWNFFHGSRGNRKIKRASININLISKDSELRNEVSHISNQTSEIFVVRQYIGELLGVNPKSLEFYHTDIFDGVLGNIRHLEEYGVVEGLSPIRVGRRKNNAFVHDYTARVLRTQHPTKPVKYVYYNNVDDISGMHFGPFLIIPRGGLFRVYRDLHRRAKKKMAGYQCPILEQELIDEVKKNTIDILARKRLLKEYGVGARRGVVLSGPPGNGKTMLCRYIANICTQRGIPVHNVSASNIDHAFSDGSLNKLFNRDGISFFDDIDISYLDRSSGNGKQACAILSAMDGMENANAVVRVFSTNESIKDMDAAFNRPGRIDKVIHIEKPAEHLRRRLVESWPKTIIINIDTDALIANTKGYSFAELEGIRSILVNSFLCDGKWDLAKSIHDMQERLKETTTKKRIGLA